MKIVKSTDEIWQIFRMVIITFPLKFVKQSAVILNIMVQKYKSCHYRMYQAMAISGRFNELEISPKSIIP